MPLDKQAREALLTVAANQVLAAQRDTKNGKAKDGLLADTLKQLRTHPCLANATGNAVHNQIKKLRHQSQTAISAVSPTTNPTASILTNDTANDNDNNEEVTTITPPPPPTKGKPGHPVGTMNAAKTKQIKDV